MTNFEERYTAWLDGAMNDEERTAFEAELPDRGAAEKDAARWGQCRALLRETVVPAPMPHADFVNNQVLAEIARTTPAPTRVAERGWFPVGRLAWTGAFLMTVAAILSFLLVPRDGPSEAQFISQVVEAHAADPKLGAYAFSAPGGKAAVLWVSDAGYIPANEPIK